MNPPYDRTKKYMLVLSPRIGDSLVTLVLAHNLVKNNYNVDVFGDFAFQLASWFPELTIYPLTGLTAEQVNHYDVIIEEFKNSSISDFKTMKPLLCIHELEYFREGFHMVEIQMEVCRRLFGIEQPTMTNGLVLPSDLQSRKYQQRVIIHALATVPLREWPLNRYIALAKELNQNGFECHFIASPKERERIQPVLDAGLSVPIFSSLSETARFIAESGYFIGNFSGIAHLSSNLGIPTLGLAVRPGEYRLWRPYWAKGSVILPPSWLISRQLKEAFWKKCISVKKVKNCFLRLAHSKETL